MPIKIGEILQSQGLITAGQFEEGLQAALVADVRLGTMLVQLGFLRLDDLGRCLSIQHGVPHATQDLLLAAAPAVIGAIPRDLCAKHAVVPLRREGKSLHLAMRDPLRHIAGELSFALQLSVSCYVAPELRIMYHLEHRYQIARDPRFLRASDENRIRDERRTYLVPTVSADLGPGTWAEERGGISLDQDLEPAVQQVGDGSPGGDRIGEATEPEIEAFRVLDLVSVKLEQATSGAAIARLLVEPVVEHTAMSVLFWVRGDSAIGCCVSGVNSSLSRLQRLVVPLGQPSFLQRALQQRRSYRGVAGRDPLMVEIVRYLGGPAVGEVCVVPLALRDKVVNLLCVLSFQGTTFPEGALHDLHGIGIKGSEAYERLGRLIGGNHRGR